MSECSRVLMQNKQSVDGRLVVTYPKQFNKSEVLSQWNELRKEKFTSDKSSTQKMRQPEYVRSSTL